MLIIGAQGFAKQLLEAAMSANPQQQLYFFDNVDLEKDLLFDRFTILHTEEAVNELFQNEPDFALGIGNPVLRKKFAELFSGLGGKLTSIIAVDCFISSFFTHIKKGTTILSGAYIESNVQIGMGCLINLHVLITHDCRIGDFCELSPGAKIMGRADIGSMVSIGAGAIILPKVKVGDGAIIGAGAVVTKDVPAGSTVVGVPGRVISK